MRRCPCRIHKGCVALQFFNHLLVFLIGLHAGNTKRHNFHASQITPSGRKLFIESFCQFLCMSRQRGVTDTHFGNLSKCRLECRQKFRLHLSCDLVCFVVLADIAAYVGVEQQRVYQTNAVFTEASNPDVQINTCPLIYHTEWNRRRGTILVAYNFFCIKVVNSLVFWCFSTKCKTLSDILEYLTDAFTKITGKNTWFRRHIIYVLTSFSTHIHHFALLNNQHTLTVCHCNDRAVGNDIIITLVVAGATCDFLFSFYCQYIRRNRFTIEELFPLIRHNATGCTSNRFD